MSAIVETRATFRERLRSWMRPPRELVMTTSGKFLCALTLGIGFGAVNTGNNLLFLLLGMLLALILASGVLSEAVMREVRARRKLPRRFTAGAASPGNYRVKNDKRYATLSIEVSDRNAVAVAGPVAGQEFGPPVVSWWKFWKGKPDAPQIASGYSMRLDAQAEAEIDARFELPVRGRFRLSTVRITTRFPFGFFEKSRRIDDEVEVTVYPAGTDADDWVATVWGRFGEVPLNRRGPGEDYFGLREYRAGEDRRQIHWKSSARRGALVIKENEKLTQREVEVVFCDWHSGTPVPAPLFEHGVSKTVGLLSALAERGWRVGLRTSRGRIEPNLGANHFDAMLAELAVVTQEGSQSKDIDVDGPARIAIGSRAAIDALAFDADLTLTFEEANDA